MTPEQQKQALALIRRMANLLTISASTHPLSASASSVVKEAEKFMEEVPHAG